VKAKQLTAWAFKFIIAGIVLAFLGLHSINFFSFVFPVDQSYLAWLGFGLTGGGAVGYLIMFLWDAGSVLKSWISLGMCVLCSIGEVASALFGMQIESWSKAGFILTEQDFNIMLLVVGILAIVHFFALIGYFAGEKIGALFSDKDGDGIPDAVDPVDNRESRQTTSKSMVYVSDVDAVGRGSKNAFTNPVTEKDREIANSIGLGIAPYRSCRNCDSLVGLSQSHCQVCGAEMTPISSWKGNGSADPTKAAPKQ
jgi:hypothetical protein